MIKLIIFDFNRTLFDVRTGGLIPGCLGMINKLSEDYDLVVLSSKQKGRQSLINKLLEGSGIKKIVITKEKNEEDLKDILSEFKVKPYQVMLVGDYIKEEILLGNKVGTVTVWFRNGFFSKIKPENKSEKPDYILDRLNYSNLLKVLNSLD